MRAAFKAVGAAASAAAGAAALSAIASPARASGETLEPPEYAWSHKGPFSTFDAASVRRGHMVYTQVCASCHSMNRINYRNLVGVCYTEEEVKKMAANITVIDGPNDQGEMFDRPGKLSDHFPAPYKNEEQARAINNGAYPPDLSLMVKAPPRREDYIFALLLGYKDVPAGVTLGAGQYYNPYFPGSKIGMPKQLVDGALEYPDGTPSTESQMAKDVATFLAWASEPDHDDRKKYGLKWIIAITLTAILTGYYKRFRWMPVKNRKITYTD